MGGSKQSKVIVIIASAIGASTSVGYFLSRDIISKPTTVFHTNCTRPTPDSTFSAHTSSGFNIISTPNTRGTSEILWSCIFTLLICTWQVQHLNVPPLDISTFGLFFRKPFYMLATLVAPELILGEALGECVQAWRSVRYMKRELPELVEHGGWTMTHAFYAAMYGFMMRKRVVDEEDLASTPISIDKSMFQTSVTRQSDLVVLNTERMVMYYKSLPPPRKLITETDIRCRAKGDIFLKFIAGLQIVWFVVQMCARKAQNLSISQLEISVVAYAVCTFISYTLWMKKPQDVSVPIILDEGPETLPISKDWSDTRKALDCYEVTEDYEGFNLPFGMKAQLIVVGFSVGGAIFGAIHLLAWNVHFINETDRTFWRTSSVVTTAIPPLFLAFSGVGTKFATKVLGNKFATKVLSKVPGAATYVAILIYTVGRVYLLVETYRYLWFLPAGAFALVTWSTYIPHVM